MGNFFDIELIDVNENVENFKFNKVSEEDLDTIINTFSEMNSRVTFSFSYLEGKAVLSSKFFRGILYTPHLELAKTVKQENDEASVEISKVQLKKKIVANKNSEIFSKEGRND